MNNWTPTTQQLPPDGEVVETKDEIHHPKKVFAVYLAVYTFINCYNKTTTP